jgi:hypothetical protein
MADCCVPLALRRCDQIVVMVMMGRVTPAAGTSEKLLPAVQLQPEVATSKAIDVSSSKPQMKPGLKGLLPRQGPDASARSKRPNSDALPTLAAAPPNQQGGASGAGGAGGGAAEDEVLKPARKRLQSLKSHMNVVAVVARAAGSISHKSGFGFLQLKKTASGPSAEPLDAAAGTLAGTVANASGSSDLDKENRDGVQSMKGMFKSQGHIELASTAPQMLTSASCVLRRASSQGRG